MVVTVPRSCPGLFSGNSLLALLTALVLLFSGCAMPPGQRSAVSGRTTIMETTAYCDCEVCCNWQRGSSEWLYLDFWNRYVAKGPRRGKPYTGLTASGTVPYEPQEGFFSWDSLERPWMIPLRLVLFPWYFLPEDGTIAADTRHYPFGTRMHVPGYGWGVVRDRGRDIKGPTRIDLYFNDHDDARNWGRRKVPVHIERRR
jgi:hypothetical protein